jgi:hypothetical protein
MRVVAFYAIAFHHHFMTAFGILGYDPFMTFITDLIGIFVEQLPVRGRMRVMTFRAFSGFHRGMNKWIFQLFLKGIVAFQTEFPLGARFEFKLILRVSKSDNRK